MTDKTKANDSEQPDEHHGQSTGGGGEIPDSHRITAKTRGEAELETLPDPDETYPSLNWNHGPSTEQHFQCSCGEPLDDSPRQVVNHLIDVGAYDGEPITDGGEDTENIACGVCGDPIEGESELSPDGEVHPACKNNFSDDLMTDGGESEPSGITIQFRDNDPEDPELTPEFISDFLTNNPEYELETATFRLMTEGEDHD